MNSNKRRMSPYQDPHAFYMLIFQSRSGSFPEKMKITAISAVTQCFGASKSYFFQTAVCNVVSIAKQTAQLRTAVFYASGVPKALFNGKIKVILAVSLFAFL